MTPTRVAAPPAVKPATSVAVPAATEIREIPAVTEIARVSMSMYHWGVLKASRGVKSRPAARAALGVAGPPLGGVATVYPAGGLRKTDAPAMPATR